MTMLREDPKARERSLMFKSPTVCDGQKDGIQCKHYWMTVSRIDVANPDELRSGRKDRFCILLKTPYPMGEGASEMATFCNQYEPGRHAYDPEKAENNPMTKDEILALRAANPTDPLLDPTTPEGTPHE